MVRPVENFGEVFAWRGVTGPFLKERDAVAGDVYSLADRGTAPPPAKLPRAHILLAQATGCKVSSGLKVVAGSEECYPSGNLKSAKLSQDQKIKGIKFTKGTQVEFDKSGNVRR